MTPLRTDPSSTTSDSSDSDDAESVERKEAEDQEKKNESEEETDEEKEETEEEKEDTEEKKDMAAQEFSDITNDELDEGMVSKPLHIHLLIILYVTGCGFARNWGLGRRTCHRAKGHIPR
jgi:hypothetical protein